MQAETEHKVNAIRASLDLLRQHIGWMRQRQGLRN